MKNIREDEDNILLNQDGEPTCTCVGKHVPLPTKFFAISLSGRVEYVCPTTFYNVEQLLVEYRIYETFPPGRVRKHYSKYVQDLCLELWNDNLRSKDMTNT